MAKLFRFDMHVVRSSDVFSRKLGAPGTRCIHDHIVAIYCTKQCILIYTFKTCKVQHKC